MKRILLPLAALAMISACKKADPAPVATDTAMATTAAAATPAVMPTVGANARTTLQYAGDYRQTSKAKCSCEAFAPTLGSMAGEVPIHA